jgi:hypothetical protein
LEDPDWKYDNLPEIMDGKNVYDFTDPDIEARLNALEEEEERLEAEGFYDSDDEIVITLLSTQTNQSWTMKNPKFYPKQMKSALKSPFAKMNPV